MKKFSAFIVSTAFVFSCIPPAAAAEGEIKIYTVKINDPMIVDYIPAVNGNASLSAENKTIFDVLAEAMENFGTADVAEFGITDSDLIAEYYGTTLVMHPLLWYVSATGSFTYNYDDNGVITAVTPIDYITKNRTEISSVQQQIVAKRDVILAGINNTMTNLEKALYINDWIALHSYYDKTLTKYTAKELLLEGTAVCQGYASAYYYLLGYLGIPVGLVRSSEMGHIWNAVYINGHWYHVDTTWDDPTLSQYSGDETGADTKVLACHGNFLKSNAGITAAGHSGFTEVTGADDTTYDNAFWDEIDSPIIIESNNWYYVNTNTASQQIMRYNSLTGETKTFYSKLGYWSTSGGYWTGTYSGLGYYDGKLYFNTQDAIKSIDLNGGNVETVYTYSSSDNSIYGLYVDGSTAHYGTGPKSYPFSTAASTLALTANTAFRKLYVIDDYTKNGSRYICVLNNTGKSLNAYDAAKTNGMISGIKSDTVTGVNGTFRFSGAAAYTNPTVYIWSDVMKPILIKK